MMPDQITIIPGKGFGRLKFGMYKEDVVNILGEPEEIEDPDEEGDIIYNYEKKGIVFLCFSKEDDYRLTSMELNKNSTALLWGEKIFNMPLDKIRKLINSKGYSLKYEYYVNDRELDSYQELFVAKEIISDFWFNEEKKLDEITFGVFFKNENEIEWPD